MLLLNNLGFTGPGESLCCRDRGFEEREVLNNVR